ncbi:MAG TPA: conjugal transfer pilus assembly protein TraU [Gammaproteobacteria bacterium]|jgi:conjugal transfer pilus assembly protein TraU|nr:conjugal transfer pilus assembly protein TraU [Gammaproteobacteria bacterium]
MKLKVLLSFILLGLYLPTNSLASGTCQGNFVNPITDVCWSCLFPMTIGSTTVFNGSVPDSKEHPSSPICLCGTPIVRPGISTGFWEPIAMTDVTRTPFCMVNLGGMQLSLGAYGMGAVETANSDNNNSFYYVHWYKYPLLYWLNIITDEICLETGDLDIAYLTELDPTWNDDELGFLINPEAFLFGNLVAQAACAADSAAALIGLPLDSLFWCAGAHGSMYPLNGHVQEHVGGVQASALLSERMAYKMHRELLLTDSVGENSPALCYTYRKPIMPKSRYRYQMVNPVPTTGSGGCYPFGATTVTWESGHEIPFQGEDFGYLIWRKRNCCAF